MVTGSRTQGVIDGAVLSQLSRPLVEARGLPAEAYTSEAVFQHETDRLFRKGWLSVAFNHDVPKAGDALPLTVAGVELIILRDRDGNVRAFHNVCRHRASTILQEPARGLSVLRCPYHAWTYELDGQFRGAPFFDGTGSGRPRGKGTGLAEISCGVWQDLIFVNLTGDAPPLDDYVAPLAKRWQRYDLDAFEVHAHGERVIEANWKVVMEGLLEVYHEAFVHDALGVRVGPDGKPTWRDVMAGDVMGFEGILPDDDDSAVSPLPRVPGMPETGPASSDIFLLFPATSINVMDTHIVRTIWTPVSVSQTRWRSCWYFAPEVQKDKNLRKLADEIVAFWHEVRQEDLAAVLAVQKGLSSFEVAPTEIRFSPFWEEIVRHFQRHVAERLA
jgi:choline monooxygenase